MSNNLFKITKRDVKSKKEIKQPWGVDTGVLPKVCFRSMTIGRSNSGKGQLWINLLLSEWGYKDYFDNIYLISGTAVLDGNNEQLEKYIPQEHMFLPNEDVIQLIMDQQEESIESNGWKNTPTALILIDDILAYSSFLRSDALRDLLVAGRHRKISTNINTQHYKGILPVLRNQMSCMFFFIGGASDNEIKSFSEENCPANMNLRQAKDLFVNNVTGKYDFIFVNRECSCDSRFGRYRLNLTHRLLEPPVYNKKGKKKRKKGDK